MAFSYKREVSIDNTGLGSTLTNYQVKVSLTSGNFDFTHAESDGSDLRFFADEARTTPLDYWIEDYDSVGETATIWVEVDSIAASSTETVWMFYGDATLTAASSIRDTFVFGDDFTQYPLCYNHGNHYIGGLVTANTGDLYLLRFDMIASPNVVADLYKSTDDGASWSLVKASLNAASDRSLYNLETDGAATPTFWASYVKTDFTALYVRKSTDGGITWGSEVTIATGSGIKDNSIVYVSSSLLLCLFHDKSGGNDRILCYASTDGGANWSSRATVHSETSTGINTLEDVNAHKLANGDIIVGWEREVAEGGAASFRCSVSDDNGSTWGSEVTIANNTGEDDEGGDFAQIADGTIYAIYPSTNTIGLALSNAYNDSQVHYKTSSDGGATWSSEALLYESRNTIEIKATVNANDEIVIGATKGFKAGALTLASGVTFIPDTANQFSDYNWTQDSPAAWVESVGGEPAVRVEYPNADDRCYFTNSQSGSDYILEMRARTPVTNEDIRVQFRQTDVNNHYLWSVGLQSNTSRLYERVSGTYTQIDSVAFTTAPDTWYDLRVVLNGTSIKTYIDDVLKNDITDASFSSGKVGLGAANVSTTVPNFFTDFRVRKFASTEPPVTTGSETSASGSSVSATLATLEIAGLSASVSVGTTVEAATASVELSGLQASVSVGTTIEATAGSVEITGLAASISVGTTIAATTATLEVDALAASVSVGTTIQATLATVELAGLSVGVSAGTSITATTATAEISGLSASVDNTATINATLGTMQVSGLAASVSSGTNITATTATMEAAGLSANVSAGTTIQSTLATVDVSPLSASVSVGTTIDATLATLEVTAFAASVSNAVAFTGFIYVTGEQMLKSTVTDEQMLKPSVTGEQMLKPSVTDETMIHGN